MPGGHGAVPSTWVGGIGSSMADYVTQEVTGLILSYWWALLVPGIVDCIAQGIPELVLDYWCMGPGSSVNRLEGRCQNCPSQNQCPCGRVSSQK